MPLDPGLLQELEKRGISTTPGGGAAAPAQKTTDPGLKAELQKRGLWKGLEEKTEEKTSAGAGLWEGLKQGIRDVAESGAQIGAKMMQAGPEEGAGAFDNPAQRQAVAAGVPGAIQRHAEAYKNDPAVQQHPNMALAGRVGGNVAASAPLMAVPGASGAGLGMAGRGLLGAGMGAATGGLPGAVAGAGLGAVGGAIGPLASPAMQAIAQKYPNLAGMATGSMGRSEEAFQRATANEVLHPMGDFVDRSVKVGHSLINEVGEKLDAAYNKLLPKTTFRAAEPDLKTGMAFSDLISKDGQLGQMVPEAFANDYTKLVKRVITDRLDEGGAMSGEAFKKAQSEIGKVARKFSTWKADPVQESYGDVLHDLQASMRATLRTQNPIEAPILEQIDKSWARYVRLRDAAGRRVGGEGEFTPIDLLHAAKRGEGNAAFAEGNRLMQGFGTAGLNLVQGKPTNVQKVLMDVAGAGVGGAVGSMMGGPAGAAGGAAAGGAAAHLALPAMRGLGRASRTDTARELGAATSRAAPVAGAGERERKRRDPYVSSSGL